MTHVRIDTLLVKLKLLTSRERAKKAILAGRVELFKQGRWQVVVDPSYLVPSVGEELEEADLALRSQAIVRVLPLETVEFVSRGGDKLEGLLAKLNLRAEGLRVLDVGMSTGGFTECVLRRGARTVVGLDVGHGQLHPSLRDDPRVLCFEHIHVRYLTQWLEKNPQHRLHQELSVPFDWLVMDVSFISCRLLLPEVLAYLKETGRLFLLIKPQFELGPESLNSSGVVKAEAGHHSTPSLLENLRSYCEQLGLQSIQTYPSTVLGKEGNQEYFLCGVRVGSGEKLTTKT